VTALDPRTPHQPEKLSNCQRTIVFYTFYFFGQSKKLKSNCFGFNRVQLVHRGMQRGLCNPKSAIHGKAAREADFGEFRQFSRVYRASNIEIPIVKIVRESVLGGGFEAWVSCLASDLAAPFLAGAWQQVGFSSV
jgi:hypothetical protein